MKRTCKLLSAFLVVLMLCALLPASAWAVIERAPIPPITWAETDANGENGHVFAIPGPDEGKAYCNGIPGEVVTLPNGVTLFIRNTIDDQYLYANEIWSNMIRNAPKGGTVKIDASGWYSLNCFVADAMADRPDVNVEYTFCDYDTRDVVRFSLPAGTNLRGLMDGKEVIQFTDLVKKLAA